MFRIDLIDTNKNTVKVVPETLDTVCRLCLKESGTTNIFDETFSINGKKYSDLISILSTAQVQENDNLPSNICDKCATKLNDFYMYKQQIETSHILLCIALGKVIVQPPAKQLKIGSNFSIQLKTRNLNKENEIIMIKNDEDNQTNLESSNVEKENLQEINKIDTQGSMLHNSNEEDINEDVMASWKNDYSCIYCNSNPNTHPERNFYSFPLNHEKCNTWKKVMKLDKIKHISAVTCHKWFRLCNIHFAPSMFYGKFKNKLKETAIPTHFTEEEINQLKDNVPTQNVSPVSEINEVSEIIEDSEINEASEINEVSETNEVSTPNELLLVEIGDFSDNEVVPYTIADQSYTKKITEIKTEVKEVIILPKNEVKEESILPKNEVEEVISILPKIEVEEVSILPKDEVKEEKSKSTRFQCISFDEKGNKIYTCCFCFETFEDSKSYKSHKYKEYKKRRKPPKIIIACTVCGKLVNKNRIKDHMVTHTGTKSHICDICGKGYSTRSILHDHLLTHNGTKQKVCSICGKGFFYSHQLEEHIMTHNTVPSYMCHICGYTCWTRNTLKKHENNHVGIQNAHQTKPKTRRNTALSMKKECGMCHKKFNNFAQASNHMRIHTEERPFKCQDCDKCFKQSGQLYNHRLLHTGVKAHECDFCGKRFTLKSNLQQHVRTHTGDKPHQCDVCEKRFYTNSCLRKHKQIHENDLEFNTLAAESE